MMAKKLKISKMVGGLGSLLSLAEAVKVIEKVSANAAPLIDKAIDRHYDNKRDLIPIQNLVQLDFFTAKQHLESQGLKVVPLLAKPLKKYHDRRADEVVDMVPKTGKLRPGSIVKLYVIDQATLLESQRRFQEQVMQTRWRNKRIDATLSKPIKHFKFKK